jgi:hypothetical protein
LIRVSTPFCRLLEGVDGRDKPGQDEVIRPTSSFVRPQDFPGGEAGEGNVMPGLLVEAGHVVPVAVLADFYR